METKGQQQQGQDPSVKQGQSIDARYSEEPHVITDRLRSSIGSTSANGGDFLVIGQRPDGSPFAWSTADESKTQELAKSAAPVLAGLTAE